MRALWVLSCLYLLGAAARADGDPLYEGRDLLRGAERERGVALLRGVIAEAEAEPKDAQKQQRAGRAHMYLDEDTQAVAAMERALALEPENVRFAFWVGAAWLPLDVDRSIAAFERAVALGPADADAWFGLGRARDDKKDFPGAVTALRKCVELDPEYTDAHYRLGRTLERLERDEDAIAALRRTLELDPARVDAGRRLGLLEYRAGRFEKARDAWLAAEPHAADDDLHLRAQVAQAFFALGRFADAEPWREKVRRIHAAAKDEATRALEEFCFDQFVVDDARVTAYERFDRSENALYRYVFRVTRDGKPPLRVNLEPMIAIPELGVRGGFCLGANDEEGHITYKKRWTEEPPYPELQAAVADAIRGKLPMAIRSRRGK